MSINYFVHILILLGLGTLGALIAIRLKVPTAVFIGPILFVGAYQVFFGHIIDKPNGLRVVVQIAVGIILGTSITKEFLYNFKSLIWPTLTVCITLLSGAFIFSLCLKYFAGWDYITSILAVTPGGQAEMALLSDSVGAQTEKVIVLQLIRSQLTFIVLLPLAKFYLHKREIRMKFASGEEKKEVSKDES